MLIVSSACSRSPVSTGQVRAISTPGQAKTSPQGLSRPAPLRAESALDPALLAISLSPPALNTAWAPLPTGRQVRVGATSHHLLAAGHIDRFFADAAANIRPSRVLILSPRHFGQGQGLVAISRRDWETGIPGTTGRVSVDRELFGAFIGAGAMEDDDSFIGEHGIGALVPFISKHWPGIPILPVVLEIDERSLEALVPLAELLIQEMTRDPDLFLLLSVDFSHHEGLEITRERDARSRPSLENLSFESHWHIYSDNASGFFILSRVLDHFGWNRGHIAGHTSGYELVGATEDITSYFFAYWPATDR